MRNLLSWVGGFLVAAFAGFVVVPKVMAIGTLDPSKEYAKFVNPTPLAPKHPYKVTLSGSASVCQKLQSKGLRVELDCTVDCAWDAAQYLPDAGYNIPYVDGGFGLTAETADGNQLPSATPRVAALPSTLDSICVYSSSAGTAYVSETY